MFASGEGGQAGGRDSLSVPFHLFVWYNNSSIHMANE